VLLNPAVLVVSGLSDVLGAIGQILLSYLVHMHSYLRSLGQRQVHVGPITWEVLPQGRSVCSPRATARAGSTGERPSGRRDSAWAVRPPGVQGAQSKGGAEAALEADLGGGSGGRGPRDFPPGTVDHGPERVSISECLRPGFSFVCPGRDFLFSLSKRSHGLTDLAPRKALKTAPACVAGAAPGLAVQPTFSQGVPPQGAQAAPVAVEQVPEAGSSAEAAIVIGKAADADVVPSPPDVSAMPAPAATEVAAAPVRERSVAADVETADASALGASEEGGGVETQSVPPGGSLVAVRQSSEGRRQLLRFRTREASDPVFVLDDEREDQSWDELRECAEATVGSLRSSLEVFCRDIPKILQVTVSGIPFLFCDRGVLRDAPLTSLRI
jgi:hypothetical protein